MPTTTKRPKGQAGLLNSDTLSDIDSSISAAYAEQDFIPQTEAYDVYRHWDTGSPAYHQLPPDEYLPPPEPCASLYVYHYTDVVRLANKLKAGCIYPWTEESMPRAGSVAWFSTNPIFEPSAVAAHTLRLHWPEAMAEFGRRGSVCNAARVVVAPNSAPYRWDHYWWWAGASGFAIGALAESMLEQTWADPNDWRVNPKPVPAADWLAVQVWEPDALCWIPLHQTRDRMLLELVDMLPPHLRPPRWEATAPKRLCSDVRTSKWLLNQFPQQRVADWDEAAEAVDRFLFKRARWYCADKFAKMGFAVFPLGTDGRSLLRMPAPIGASSHPDMVDRWWLVEHPGTNLGLRFGKASRGLFGLKLSGWHRRRSLGSNCPLPETIAFRTRWGWDDEPDTVLLYRARGVQEIPTFVLRKTQRGAAHVLGEQEWVMGPGSCDAASSTWVCDAPILKPAYAPEWLLDAINARSHGGPYHV